MTVTLDRVLNYNYIEVLIQSIPLVTAENKKTINENLVNSIILEVINNIDNVDHYIDKKFRECFGKINFRVNLLKQSHHLQKIVDQKMDQLANAHGIKRYKYEIARLKDVTGKIKKMIGDPSKVESHHGAATSRKTKPLSEEYWKEFFDKWNRHPKILDKIFNEWKVYGHYETKDFWEYLKEIEESGKVPELTNPDDRVIYLSEKERMKYKCSMQMSRDDQNVNIVTPNGEKLKDGLYITVLGPDCNLYVAEKVPGKFQHASFFSGKSVISAGLFLVKDGHIQNFISHSGHYKPEKLEMFKMLHFFEENQVDISKFRLTYDVGGEEPIEIKNPKEWPDYQDFLNGKMLNRKEGKPGSIKGSSSFAKIGCESGSFC